jgi:hypothetical protein
MTLNAVRLPVVSSRILTLNGLVWWLLKVLGFPVLSTRRRADPMRILGLDG